MRIAIALSCLLLAATAAQAEPQVHVVPDLSGNIPPSIQAPFTFPDDMAGVDSVSVRLVGGFTEGVGRFWGHPEYQPLPHRPEVHAGINGVIWVGNAPETLESGAMDVVFGFVPMEEVEMSDLGGVVTEIYVDFNITSLWEVTEWPTSAIETVEVWLWTTNQTPIEARSLGAIKSLFE